MKKILPTACAFAIVFVGSAFSAQDKATAAKQSNEVRQETKTTTANHTAKTSTDKVHGKVESYEPGKSIKVTVPGKIVQTKSFDLDAKDTTANVASNVKPGQWVSVVEKTDNNGHKTITVTPSTEKHSPSVKKTDQ